MIDWRPHKVWAGLLLLAIIIGANHATVLGLAQQKADRKLLSLKIENTKTAGALQQLQNDIAATEKMKAEIGSAEMEKFLAPVDRLNAAQMLENSAEESRLTHVTYTLSPEEKTLIKTVGAGEQELATSQWTLAADAPTDVDAYAFLNAISLAMPGRFTLNQMSLERIGDTGAPLSDANVRLSASGEWLSNGANPDLAEEAQ